MKILKEYCENENIYAKTIHEVEKFMEEKNVSLCVLSGDTVLVRILDKDFFLRTPGATFPRLVEDEKLYLE